MHSTLSFFEDALYYYQAGIAIAQEWLASGSSVTFTAMMRESNVHHAWGVILLITFFSVLGNGLKSMPILMVLYALITSWAPVITYKIARVLGIAPASSFIAALLVVFSPCFAFWGGTLYKDGLVFLVLNLIVYHTLLLQKRLRVFSIAIIVLLMFYLLTLRFYMPIFLLPSLGLGLLLGHRRKDANAASRPTPLFAVLLKQGLIIIFLAAILTMLGLYKRIEAMIPMGINDMLQNAQGVRDDFSRRALSGYLVGADLSSLVSMLKYLPTGVAYFLTVPFPWQLGSMRQNLIWPEMIFWLPLYPVILLGMKRGLRLNFQGSVLLMTITIIMSCGYGLYVGNVGTAYRMRSQIWLFWVIFVGWYHEKKSLKIPRGPSVSR